MAALSDYAETIVRDYVLGLATHVAAYTSNPGEDNSGAEVSGNGYARQPVTFASGANTGEVRFMANASGGGFGTITHIALCDALTGGNMLAFKVLPAPQVIGDSGELLFETGDITGSAD